MDQAVANLCLSRKVFLKYQVNWNTVSDVIEHLPGRNIWLTDNPVVVLNDRLFLQVGRRTNVASYVHFILWSSVFATRKALV